MALKAVHDKQDEIPEAYRELYTEKDSKWELTGIAGIKTQADIDRVNAALKKERDEHKATKDKLKAWGELDPEDVHERLDKLPELEAAAKGKLDEAKIEDIVAKRVEGVLKSKLAPVERELKIYKAKEAEWNNEKTGLLEEKRSRKVSDAVIKALTGAKTLVEAHEDALLHASRIFDVRDDGAVVSKDGVGVTPGIDPATWLSEIQDRKPHWWPASQGGGARGTGPGGAMNGANPWAAEGWNVTAQAQYAKTHGMEKAAAMAKSAGVQIGATKPAAPKKS